MSSNYSSSNFQKLIDLCSDPQSLMDDIELLFYNIRLQGHYKYLEFDNTAIICYEKLLQRLSSPLSLRIKTDHISLLHDRYVIQALIKNEKYYMIRSYFMKYINVDLVLSILYRIVEYCVMYSKISILKLFISDVVEFTRPLKDEKRSEVLSLVKEKILMYSSYYCYSNNDITILIADWLPTRPSQEYFMVIILGACLGNHFELAKSIVSDPAFSICDNNIQRCICATESLDIMKLLHNYKPDHGGLASYFFRSITCIHKRFDVIDWIVDNNIPIIKGSALPIIEGREPTLYSDYIEIALRWDIRASADIFLYFILNKKLKVKKHHLMNLLGCDGDFHYLLLSHYYIPEDDDDDESKSQFINANAIDMYLSLYPTTYDKEKIKYIYTHNYFKLDVFTYIPVIEYINKYLVIRQEFHEELQLLFDLPLDLCKQIL
jgi:hypothetical protein